MSNGGAAQQYEFTVVEETPWGVPVLDVQSLTQSVLSTSRDPEAATNALSYRGDDGAELAAQPLASVRVTDSALRLPVEDPLVDGIVKRPAAMEDKWAVYLHGGQLLFVRSWQRRVVARADVAAQGRAPLDLAQGRGHAGIVERLRAAR